MQHVLGIFIVVLGIVAIGGQHAGSPRTFNTVVNLETTSEDSANVSASRWRSAGGLSYPVGFA